MTPDSLLLTFRVCAGLFFGTLILFLVQLFRKQEKRNRPMMIVALVVTLVLFATLIGIIVYSAKSDPYVQAVKDVKIPTAEMVDKARENIISRDVHVFVGVVVHLIIVSLIGVAYLFLWRRSRHLPRGIYTTAHRIILLAGMCTVVGYGGYVVYKCMIDAEFREQIYLRTYAEYFVGNIFLMLVASIVSALGLPEEKENAG